MRLSLLAAAPSRQLVGWRGPGLPTLQHASWSRWPTALRPLRQQGTRTAAGSSSGSSSSGQPGIETEGQQQGDFISAQPNQEQQQQLWLETYSQVLAFQQAHGRLPRRAASNARPLLEGEGRLGRWCALQQRRKDGSQGQPLSTKERTALQAIPGWEWDRARPTRKDWWQWLREVEAFVAQHERLPRQHCSQSQPLLVGERQLGHWCDNQRQRYRGQGKSLSSGEEAALAAIPGWFWERWQQQDWEQQYQQVVEFQQQHGKLPRQRGSRSHPLVEDEGQLGTWCNHQRQQYKGQRKPLLLPDQEAALATIPGWFWEQWQRQDWEQQYERVVAFQQQHGRLPRNLRCRSQPWVDIEQQLGNWCMHQRQRYKGQQQPPLAPGEEAALAAIPGWYWRKFKKQP